MTLNDELDDHQFSDPEDFEDDIDDDELLQDFYSRKPSEKDLYDNVIIVDNVPKVTPEKLEKLEKVLSKTFKTYGEVMDIYFPQDESNSTKGFAFVEYNTPDQAAAALKGLQNFKLDSKHIFSTVKLTDIDEFCSNEEEIVVPEKQEFKDPGDLYGWVLDEQARDHYAVIYNFDEHRQTNQVAVIQNNYSQPITLQEKMNWTEATVLWSPRGAYLASMHNKGAALWGNSNFEKIMRFKHDGIDFISFSPCETYLITLKNPMYDRPGECIIWEILSGAEKRRFQVTQMDSLPFFKWSHDEKYVAKKGDGILQVYETPTFGLLDKQSFKIPGIQSFEWSPSGNYFICWIRTVKKEDSLKDVPDKVSVIEVPSRRDLCSKSMFFVNCIHFHWHPMGDYCCVQSDLRGKKGVNHFLHVFAFGAKEIPVDLQEIKEPIQQFAWEPTDTARFIALVGENPRTTACVFSVQKGDGIRQIGSIETQANFVAFSSIGRYAVLAVLKNNKQASSTGTLEFLDIDQDPVAITNKAEHYGMYGLEWDPSGRYCATYNRCLFTKHDNHVEIFTFQGRRLQNNRMDSLYQFTWRPRPPRYVTQEQKDEIKKNFKKYQNKFETQDKMSQSKTSKELLDKRKALSKSFRDIMDKLRDKLESVKKLMEAEKTFEDIDGNEQPELDEEVVHYVVSQQVIVCDDTSNSTGKHSGQSADSTTNKLTNGTSSSAAVAVAD
ncbi:eukaryotic translation initiation factor 3 subunit B-like [Symsagittifera roscoffensis]|uniref:eukaryotic translation initiation factor 3 subunit B-like n=1 Tax=Symsagittifera roscoffensis TaxID=84072 RepID=UPI00307C0DEC